jgi:aspartyl-tRNA(Asn)/glutamyl-tRNA(Gln) amidotransferase subunit B
MRFDVNISVAKKGATELGKRAEVKNLNSFRSVERAAEYEFKRQVDLLESGEKVVQETRGWNDDKQITTSQRSKEDAQDYRYMPDADIPPIVLSDEEITDIQASVPTLPGEYRKRWKDLNLDFSVVNTILEHQPVAITLDSVVQDQGANDVAKRVFNWFSSVQADDIDIAAVASGLVGPQRLTELSEMVSSNKLSSTGAKDIFLALFDEIYKGMVPEDIAKEKNLLQVSDEGAIAAIVDEVLSDPASAASIADIKAGKDKAIGYLVGQIMKKSQGKANPSLAQKLIRERL